MVSYAKIENIIQYTLKNAQIHSYNVFLMANNFRNYLVNTTRLLPLPKEIKCNDYNFVK